MLEHNQGRKDPEMGKSKQQLLERAIEKQDVKGLKAALSKGADPNASLDNGHIPLVGAVLTGNEQIVTALIEGGANPKRKSALGETALQYAPNVKIAALLVAAGANINAVDDYGGTPLSMAASNGHPELIKWLHARGAKDGSCEPDGTTSLHGACLEADLKTVAVLLECGADPNARTKDGLTPLLYVEGMKRKAGVEIIKLLLMAGADPNAQMVDGRFPLYEAATEGSAAAVEALLAGGAKIDLHEGLGETALAAAVYEGNADTAAALLKAGANPSARISPEHGDPGRSGKSVRELAAASRSAAIRKLFKIR
jgi:ankyrin repeat protein